MFIPRITQNTEEMVLIDKITPVEEISSDPRRTGVRLDSIAFY
jgi:hypothetical protein